VAKAILLSLLLLTLAVCHGWTRKCEKIVIHLCQDIGYNLTVMPNLMGHEDQLQADRGLAENSELVNSVVQRVAFSGAEQSNHGCFTKKLINFMSAFPNFGQSDFARDVTHDCLKRLSADQIPIENTEYATT
ncbi:hypothetical protein L9F63_014453, partial [Diploptera punctata]